MYLTKSCYDGCTDDRKSERGRLQFTDSEASQNNKQSFSFKIQISYKLCHKILNSSTKYKKMYQSSSSQYHFAVVKNDCQLLGHEICAIHIKKYLVDQCAFLTAMQKNVVSMNTGEKYENTKPHKMFTLLFSFHYCLKIIPGLSKVA